MNKKTTLNTTIILTITVLCIVSIFLYTRRVKNYPATEPKMQEEEIPSYVNTEEEKIEEVKSEPLKEISYYIDRVNLYDSYYSDMYNVDIESNGDLYLPVPLVTIRGDIEKENRLNELILERCNSVLPKEKAWMDKTELNISFRSEKYLCFEYISHAVIPEDYDYKQLYFTLDLEEERWEEYPAIETKYVDEYNGIFIDGGMEKEQKEFNEKTVEEQNSLRGDAGYDVYEQTITCEGISTSCVQVRGLKDSDREKQINQLLQEPLITLIQSGKAENYNNFGIGVFEDIKIFLAYKTEKWLSVVYSIKADEPSTKTGKGLAEIGITINMQTGERVMLDDLFSLQDLEGWLVGHGFNEVYLYDNNIHGTVLTEKEIISQLDVKGQRALLYYNTALKFYLYRGELIFMDALFVNEIPLPEIYEYLKVDPWYE